MAAEKVIAAIVALLAIQNPFAGSAPAPPTCVEDLSQPHVRVAYVRDPDAPDNYAAALPRIRDAVNRSNDVMHRESMSILVECDADGLVKVRHLTVETGPNVFDDVIHGIDTSGPWKWWAAYDGANATGAGSGNRMRDDRPGKENLNNRGGSLAIVYAADGRGPWLHELLHTLGAVQESAPHSDGTGHCTDGYDIMCRGSQLDHGKDDYFSLDPAPGSYLATRWNVANSDYLRRVG